MIDNLFGTANEQIAAWLQALLEPAENFILRFLCKIDQHITAYNQMIIRLISIL